MTGYVRNLIAASSLVLSCFGFALPAAAQVTVTADESGNGTITNAAILFEGPLPASVGLDPGPGGHSTLDYGLLSPPSLVGGDVVLQDVTSNVLDIIRFSAFNGGSFFFYSSDSDGSLADTGLPSALSSNNITLSEGSGVFLLSYTPTAGQPGFVAGFTVTYDIARDLPVPGPIAGAGLPSLIFAGVGLLGWWRRKRKRPCNTQKLHSHILEISMRKGFIFAAAFVLITLPATARTITGIEGASGGARSVAGEVKIADVRCNSRGCRELPVNCKPVRGYRGLTGGGDTWRCEKKTK